MSAVVLPFVSNRCHDCRAPIPSKAVFCLPCVERDERRRHPSSPTRLLALPRAEGPEERTGGRAGPPPAVNNEGGSHG